MDAADFSSSSWSFFLSPSSFRSEPSSAREEKCIFLDLSIHLLGALDPFEKRAVVGEHVGWLRRASGRAWFGRQC